MSKMKSWLSEGSPADRRSTTTLFNTPNNNDY
jgi:hypothetical protein